MQQYYDTVQKVTATGLPAKGEDRYSFFDSCVLHNGRNKAAFISSWDGTAPGNAYTVGRTLSNVQILAERKTTNADGSARHEVDVTVDTKYTDGTSLIGGSETLIAGSSSGTQGCAAPQTGTELRFLGNRRVVGVELTSRNRIEVYRKIADGTAKSPSFGLRREVAFGVTDPGNVATYAVATWSTAARTRSLKLLSPRIARDAPEMQDARGSGTYTDTGSFRLCRATAENNLADASQADCTSTTLGLASETWSSGTINAADDAARAAADATFPGSGLGDSEVTFDIYADDGWKKVNGQSGKTPIVTYKVKIKNASYPFAQIGLDAYPQILSIDPTEADIVAKFKSTGGTANAKLQVAKPPAGALPMALSSVASFRQGPKSTSASGRYQVRGSKSAAFTAGATSLAIPFDGIPDGAKSTSYGEFTVTYSDRNGREMLYNLRYE